MISDLWLQLWLKKCCKNTEYHSIFQLALLLLLNNYQYSCNNTISSVSVGVFQPFWLMTYPYRKTTELYVPQMEPTLLVFSSCNQCKFKATFSFYKLIPIKFKWLPYILICHCTPLSPWFIILDKNNFVKVSHHYLTSEGCQVC